MDAKKLAELLQAVESGKVSSQVAFEALKTFTYDELNFAKVDSYRAIRQGIPEVIFGPGKTADQITEIALKLMEHHTVVVATKVEQEIAQTVLSRLPEGRAQYDRTARMLILGTVPAPDSTRVVSVVTAGTSDLPVAEEAALYLVANGIQVNRIFDVGVAGIHRLFPHVEKLNESQVVIVIAGMDGALASVIGGLVSTPVIAVPTSVGYGANFQGLSALLAMLSSCAAGLTTVNIDNGFGAAMAAVRIIKGKTTGSGIIDGNNKTESNSKIGSNNKSKNNSTSKNNSYSEADSNA
jgi:pyridinium-3,5-biscarboxylic acid mononucleotide synthase